MSHGLAFQSAWGKGGGPGAVLTAQTAGEALNWNPHLHGLMADGVFDEAGAFTRFNVIDLKEVTQRVAEGVLCGLSVKGVKSL